MKANNQTLFGRHYQGNEFVIDEFNGLRVEKLIICEQRQSKNITMVYIKIEHKRWHQYFLDAGLGFWECWLDVDMEDDDNYMHQDKTDTFNVYHKKISDIFCKVDGNNSKICVAIEEHQHLILQCKDPEVFDSNCEFTSIHK